MTAPRCPLCDDAGATRRHRDRTREYWTCPMCGLVFVAPGDRPDQTAEKARYDRHRNDPHDARYRAFLATLATPLLARLEPGARGLDFGCGPGPALALMLREAGMDVALYDVFYAADDAVWSRRYDFVTASEVIEHLHRPAVELDRLFRVLRPGGWLAVMTRWVTSLGAFDRSRYVRDPTHVAFYDRRTFRWIADRWRAAVEFPATDVALIRTSRRSTP